MSSLTPTLIFPAFFNCSTVTVLFDEALLEVESLLPLPQPTMMPAHTSKESPASHLFCFFIVHSSNFLFFYSLPVMNNFA